MVLARFEWYMRVNNFFRGAGRPAGLRAKVYDWHILAPSFSINRWLLCQFFSEGGYIFFCEEWILHSLLPPPYLVDMHIYSFQCLNVSFSFIEMQFYPHILKTLHIVLFYLHHTDYLHHDFRSSNREVCWSLWRGEQIKRLEYRKAPTSLCIIIWKSIFFQTCLCHCQMSIRHNNLHHL